jgi:hypothetical protein
MATQRAAIEDEEEEEWEEEEEEYEEDEYEDEEDEEVAVRISGKKVSDDEAEEETPAVKKKPTSVGKRLKSALRITPLNRGKQADCSSPSRSSSRTTKRTFAVRPSC